MITLYSGTPGSGKSLHQAEDVYYWLRAGKPCVTNYEIVYDVIKTKKKILHLYLPNDELYPDKLIEFAREYFAHHKFKEGAIRLYIDEAQLMFNAREWQIKGRHEWISFFTQHRKYGYDIYLVAQFDRMIDRQVRSLLEYEVIHRKASNFGMAGKIISLIFGFIFGGSTKMFVAIKRWYPMNERLSSNTFFYRKRDGKLYDTFKDFGVFVKDDEKIKDKPPSSASELPDGAFDERLLLLQNYANCLKQIIDKKRMDDEK